jgi:tRNA-dihydrouridine synthase 2
MIGTTRRVHEDTKTILWTRKPNTGQKIPPPNLKDNVIYQMHPEKEGRKLIFQIGTANPDLAVEAARMVAADVAGIDVNAGCPKPFSTHCGMGANLLKTPDLLCSILEALVKNIASEYEIGISVKIRILDTAAETETLVRRLVATGITGLTVHCRTTPMRPREAALRGQLRMIADICREAGVACLMNGDVVDRDSALLLIKEYGVDGAMIATSGEKNPSCFRSKADGGMAPWSEVAEQFVRYALETENKFGNTKFTFGNLIPGKMPMYKQVNACQSYTKICEALGLPVLTEQARTVDEKIGRDPDGPKKALQEHKKSNQTALAAGGKKAKFRPQPKSMDKDKKKPLSERGVTAQSVTQMPEDMIIPA